MLTLTNLILTLALSITNSNSYDPILPSVLDADNKVVYVGNNPIYNYQIAKKETVKPFFVENSEVLLANSYDLIYKDIFIATKPNFGKRTSDQYKIENRFVEITNIEKVHAYEVTLPSGEIILRDESYNISTNYVTTKTLIKKGYVMTEYNPVAEFFFKNNIWEPTFLLTSILNSQIVYFLNSMDSTGMSALSYTTILTIAEIYAINTWNSENVLPSDFYYEVPVIALKF